MGIGQLRVVSRTASKAHELGRHAQQVSISAAVIESASTAIDYAAAADLIVTTTNSKTPVLADELAGKIKPSATIVSVGAYRADLAEVPPSLVAACNVVVDSLAGAKHEAGDLIQAEAAGVWSWGQATELADHMHEFDRGNKPVFVKTVGHSTWDLAAARLAVPNS